MEFLKSDYGSLSPITQILMIVGAFFIVAFGQPAWVPPLGLLAAVFGYALLWRVFFCWRSRRLRFAVGTAWFAAVQLVQLSWMTADEYQGKYIFAVWFLLSLGVGLQFGFLSLVVRRGSLKSVGRVAAIAFLWVLLEWSRLFLLSGFSWNPVGLGLTGALYPMQLAAVGGVFGLSFVVFFTNLLVLRAWALSDEWRPIMLAATVAVLPYLFGAGHLFYHEQMSSKATTTALLVQTAQPPRVYRDQTALAQWRQAIESVAAKRGPVVDLVVFPEAMVSHGTYQPVYRLVEVEALLNELLPGTILPPLERPLARRRSGSHGVEWWVSNAYLAQAVSNAFWADVVVGLEDMESVSEGEAISYAAAFHFTPFDSFQQRYEKRILVPMGEYIPFKWARSIAATYGIHGSFTPGAGAKVFSGRRAPPLGLSICYEETFGDLIRESRRMGAELLVNVTNDAWYPNSRLPKQHFDHARLRSVENGAPLVRACNTGVTAGVDSLGRIVGQFAEGEPNSEWMAGALLVEVPRYHYTTLYSQLGDGFIIGLAFIFSGIALRFRALTFY